MALTGSLCLAPRIALAVCLKSLQNYNGQQENACVHQLKGMAKVDLCENRSFKQTVNMHQRKLLGPKSKSLPERADLQETLFRRNTRMAQRTRICGLRAVGLRCPSLILSMFGDEFIATREKGRRMIEECMPQLDELDELLSSLDLELESSSDYATSFIKKNKGIVHRLNDWGMRNLAYQIKKTSRANYMLMNIEINSHVMTDLNSLLEKDERVIRHMMISRKDAITEECPPPEEYRSSRAFEVSEEDDKDEYDDERDEKELELVVQHQ